LWVLSWSLEWMELITGPCVDSKVCCWWILHLTLMYSLFIPFCVSFFIHPKILEVRIGLNYCVSLIAQDSCIMKVLIQIVIIHVKLSK
jgi:hypothetical protein